MIYKVNCPESKRTPERIMCKVLNSICIHQYYKVCKGMYELTERAFNCPIAKKENE